MAGPSFGFELGELLGERILRSIAVGDQADVRAIEAGLDPFGGNDYEGGVGFVDVAFIGLAVEQFDDANAGVGGLGEEERDTDGNRQPDQDA